MSFLITLRIAYARWVVGHVARRGNRRPAARDSATLQERRNAPSPPTPLPRWGEGSQTSCWNRCRPNVESERSPQPLHGSRLSQRNHHFENAGCYRFSCQENARSIDQQSRFHLPFLSKTAKGRLGGLEGELRQSAKPNSQLRQKHHQSRFLEKLLSSRLFPSRIRH